MQINLRLMRTLGVNNYYSRSFHYLMDILMKQFAHLSLDIHLGTFSMALNFFNFMIFHPRGPSKKKPFSSFIFKLFLTCKLESNGCP